MTTTSAKGLAQGEDRVSIKYTFVASVSRWEHDGKKHVGELTLTWNEIFSAVAPGMIDEADEGHFRSALDGLVQAKDLPNLRTIVELKGMNLLGFRTNSDDFQTVKVQLRALGLITKSSRSRSVKDNSTYWTLTPYGDNLLTRLRAITKPET